MTAEKQNAEVSSKQELVITRTFNAPRELVFKAWTEAERVAQWWGPKGMNIKIIHFDLRPGGKFIYSLTAPDGFEMGGLFVYHEIVSPEKMVFVNSFADKDGNIVPAPFPNWPLEVKNTLTLI